MCLRSQCPTTAGAPFTSTADLSTTSSAFAFLTLAAAVVLRSVLPDTTPLPFPLGRTTGRVGGDGCDGISSMWR